jgi:YD repeat-containing protein
VEFKGGWNNAPIFNYQNLLGKLLPDGTFNLSRGDLEGIYRGTLPDGNHTLNLIAKDSFGNTSALFTYSFTLDTTIAIPGSLALAVVSDSGIVGDNITKVSTPTITGTGTVGDTIQLKEGNAVLGTAIVRSDGKWTIVSSELSNGSHSLTAIASDIAGNVSANSTALNITVDTLVPTLTLSTPLTNAVLVNNSVLAGLVTESGSNLASINYQWDNSANPITVTPDATGNFNQPLDFTGINNGSHTLTITAVDVAGNTLTNTYNVIVALDKDAPVISANLTADTGSNSADKITFDATINGTVLDATDVSLFAASFDGVNYVDILPIRQADGSFSLTRERLEIIAGKALTDGNYTLSLITVDRFGNASDSFDLVFTLDTAIAIPTNLTLAPGSDTGISGDNIANISTPTITGTGNVGDTIQLKEGDNLLGTGIVGSDGKWVITSSELTNGSHSLTAIASDIAGNISSTSTPLNISVDTLAPTLTLSTPLTNAVLVNDSVLAGLVNGSGSAIASVSYQWDNSANAIAVTPNAVGNFNQPLNFTEINNGSHTLTITAVDVAGNTLTNTYNVTVALDKDAPVITANLTNDTGSNNSDRITLDPTINGVVSDASQLTTFRASFDGVNYATILPTRQSDGSFNLTQSQLETIAGKTLTDGDYTLYLTGQDEYGNASLQPTLLNFTLDRSAPTLNLNTPTNAGTYSATVPLVGKGSDNLGLMGAEYQIDGKPAVAVTLDPEGNFNLNLSPSDLTAGSHNIDVRLTDIAGNITTTSLNFNTGNNFTISPAAIPGWGWNNSNRLSLTEGQSLVTQTSIPVTLGSNIGQRLVEFDVKAIFDLTDKTTASADQLAVYLVDPNNRSRTLLDNGKPGTALFTLVGDKADFAKGIVRYHGTRVTIDVSKVANGATTGELVFQLLNNDRDTGSTIAIDNINTRLNSTGTPGTLLDFSTPAATLGTAVDVSSYTATNNAKLVLTNVRFDAVMGKYTADIQVQNIGNSTLPRQLVLQFPDLPIGVNIASPSGIDANGVPYLNLRNAIQAGGLSAGEISAPIQVAFDDPTQVQFGLNPVFTAGALDVAPTLNQLGTLTLRPGERLNLPLIANDPNGDPIVLSIESTNNLPTGQLNAAERTLTFNPRPDQIGSYTFTVVAKQGKLVSTQDVTLNVVADEVQTTRISGRVQTDNAVPIAGLVINVGTTTATTDSNGNFTVEVPTNLTTLKVGGNGGYGAITSQLTALLGHDLYTGANNQLIEAIYLPTLGTLTNIDPTQNQIITSASLPNSRVNIAANTAKDGAGNPYTGQLSLVEVPLNQAPITLPDTFNPDVLMTLQGDVSFSSPATVTLPNRAGYTAGTKLELWALSAATGTFAKVGEGQVSADGQTVTTISGGISGSTWMCFVPQAIAPIPQAENPYNPLPTLTSYQAATPINSEAGLQTGVVMETQELFNYQSLGVQRSIGLSYNSLHAHSKPIINFGYNGYIASGNGDRLVAKLKIQRGDFWIDLPSKEWTLPPINQERITGGIQVDLSGEKTGSYRYKLTIGIQKANGEFLYGQSTVLEGQVVHVNRQKSQFGSGWGLTGLQELVIKDVGTNVVTNGGTTTSSSSGAILWVDGDGSNLVYSPGTTVNGITSYSNSLGDFSKLEKLADGTYRRTLKDQTVYNFNESGKLTSIVDRNNNATTFTYNGDKISEIIDPVGQKTQFSGNTITSPDGRIVTLGIDAQGDLLQISHPDGTSNQWVYDNHLMRVVKDQNGNRGYDEYDELGRVKKAIRKDGSEVYIKPAQVLGVVLSTSSTTPTVNTVPEPTSTQVDGNGNVIQTTLDKFGQTTSVRDSIGKVSTIQRDLHGNEVKTTDGLGNITSYTYDERNNLTGITYGDIGDVTPVNIPPFNDSITAYTLPNSGRPTHVATGDLNKDGIMDVVTATTSGQITTFFGNGNGTFTQSQNFTLKNFGVILSTDTCTVKKLLVRDFNGDGNLDIVVGYNSYVVANNYDTSIVVAMQGSATGTFTNSSTRNIKYAITNQFNAFDRFSFDIADVALGDLNGDGKLDITASNALGATPNLYNHRQLYNHVSEW